MNGQSCTATFFFLVCLSCICFAHGLDVEDSAWEEVSVLANAKELHAKNVMLQSKLAAAQQTIAERDQTIAEQKEAWLERSKNAPKSPISKQDSIQVIEDAPTQMLSVTGFSDFFPEPGPGTHGSANERSAKSSGAQKLMQRRDPPTRQTRTPSPTPDPAGLPWGVVEYPKGGPIDDTSSRCRHFWNGPNGPAQDGAKGSADYWFNKEKGRLGMKTQTMVPFPTWGGGKSWQGITKGAAKSGENFSVGVKWGCTGRIRGYTTGGTYWVCGCHEMWCPSKDGKIASIHDKRKNCFSLRKLFGCYKSIKVPGSSSPFPTTFWHPDCRHTDGAGFAEATLF